MRGFHERPIDIGLSVWSPLLVAVAFAGVYLSSLVDWFVILPRISGMLGPRPCRASELRHPRFPHTWRETTRYWLVHRSVAFLLLRFGLGYALALTLHRYISVRGGVTIVVGATFGLFGSYLGTIRTLRMRSFRTFGTRAGHLPVSVG